VRRFALAIFLLLLSLPTVGAAQSQAVARNGSAIYTGLTVMVGTTDAPRHLYLSFEAQCRDVQGAERAVSPEAREAVILLLRGKTVADVSTPQGKNRLKDELVAALNRAIGSPQVVRVLFLQFLLA